jgi:hypothetical protein
MSGGRYNRRVHDLLASTQSVRIGGGRIQDLPGGGCRLSIPPVSRGYADAQIDDTQGIRREQFCWMPPLRLTISAQASPAVPSGTYGFGLWNDPFAVSLGMRGAARRLPCGPRALWFFYASPPNEFGFTSGPRSGWRAMSIDTPQFHPLWLTPAALAVAALAQIPILRRPVMQAALRQVSAAEAVLTSAANELHEYELVWERSAATFRVDGQVVLRAAAPPRAPLGFVAWIDNQYAIATPENGLRFGTLATEAEQSLDLRLASIAPLAG